MKMTERIVILFILTMLLGGAGWFYLNTLSEQTELRAAVARGEYEIPMITEKTEVNGDRTDTVDWQVLYPNTVAMTIGEAPVEASVADSISERIRGLSETPYLPDNVVKLFVFGSAGEHSIWMKDMNYPIDIMWVAEDGEIVHIEEDVATSTYPESFSSPIPAWYVVESNAGFVASNSIAVGDEVIRPQ